MTSAMRMTGMALGAALSTQFLARRRVVCAESSMAATSTKESNHGWSVDQLKQKSAEVRANVKELDPQEVLASLQCGNARFWTGKPLKPEVGAFERRALALQQFPTVAILSCSDSRVPAEIVFDQALGDMFVVRVAGNALDTVAHASLQYAVEHLHVKVVVVMGHEYCGAVKAAELPLDQLQKEPEVLSRALRTIKAGLDEERLALILDKRAHDREAVLTNVKRQLDTLSRDPVIAEKVRGGKLLILGAFYEVSSGIVDFLE